MQVIAGLSPEEVSGMLRFVTACRRAPLGGFQHLRPAFCIHQVVTIPLFVPLLLSHASSRLTGRLDEELAVTVSAHDFLV